MSTPLPLGLATGLTVFILLLYVGLIIYFNERTRDGEVMFVFVIGLFATVISIAFIWGAT